ncbi:microtubule cross-linking factor 1-like [Oryctolagus cuniculus]|uniref:microtubule cross-linking factor 1-like n=1 Tax=Oryctolagus cuniculus TaxID=9986 RepID=UPI00387A1A4A
MLKVLLRNLFSLKEKMPWLLFRFLPPGASELQLRTVRTSSKIRHHSYLLAQGKPAPGRKDPRRRPPPEGPGGRRRPECARLLLLTFGHLPVADVLQVVALAGSEIQLGGLHGSGCRRHSHRVAGRRLVDLGLVVRLRRPRAPAQLGAGIGGHATGQRVPHGAPPLLSATVCAFARPRLRGARQPPPPPTMARSAPAAPGYAGAAARIETRPRPPLARPPCRPAPGRAPASAAPPPPRHRRLPRADLSARAATSPAYLKGVGTRQALRDAATAGRERGRSPSFFRRRLSTESHSLWLAPTNRNASCGHLVTRNQSCPEFPTRARGESRHVTHNAPPPRGAPPLERCVRDSGFHSSPGAQSFPVLREAPGAFVGRGSPRQGGSAESPGEESACSASNSVSPSPTAFLCSPNLVAPELPTVSVTKCCAPVFPSAGFRPRLTIRRDRGP